MVHHDSEASKEGALVPFCVELNPAREELFRLWKENEDHFLHAERSQLDDPFMQYKYREKLLLAAGMGHLLDHASVSPQDVQHLFPTASDDECIKAVRRIAKMNVTGMYDDRHQQRKK